MSVQTKPAKPSPDFPLFPHARGKWAKKIDGRLHYFGRWDDPNAALADYEAFKAGMDAATSAVVPRDPARAKGPAAAVPDDFPLFRHTNGQWCKKIRGKNHYFGVVADPDSALAAYHAVKDDLHAGRRPRVTGEGVTVKNLLDQFMESRRLKVESHELTLRSFADYQASCRNIAQAFGESRLLSDIGPDDFVDLRKRLADRVGPTSLGNEIGRIRVVFNYAGPDNLGLTAAPIRFGPLFKRAGRKVQRRLKAAKRLSGQTTFSADEIRTLVEQADEPLRTMILLGINGGLGNADLGRMTVDVLDLDDALLDYPRPKTGEARLVPLWPETVKALREWLPQRPKPSAAEHGRFVFLTKYGQPWHREDRNSPLSHEMAKAMDRLGISRGRNFYALRHTFETVAGGARDQVAVNLIMGHVDDHISANYRHEVSRDRLNEVVNHVRRWLGLGRRRRKAS